jgi:hypothetical protein
MERMERLTAVEWLVEQWPILESQIPERILEQAKEMEKEQMKLACVRTEYEDKAWQNLMEKHFEQWYNETFKSE